MTTTHDAVGSLAEAFTREHHEIDAGIETYLASDGEPAQRTRPLLRALAALRRHIYLEEEIVFPHLPGGALMMPLMVMRREHGELWQRMDALAARLDDVPATAAAIAEACTQILELLDAHNAKEEPIIYPYMDPDLTDDETERVRVLLVGGTLPDGWVCQALRG